MRDVTIRLTDVRFRYGADAVLDGVSLEVEAGEMMVVTGANGSGKTTLLRLCVGLLRPESGTVEVLGGSPADPAVRRRVGYAPQGSRVPTSLPVSVHEVVAAGLAPALRFLHRQSPADRDRIEQALVAVGLVDLSSECLFELSGGQQQRAMLARALVSQPDVLLLDEPTTGLDVPFRPALVDELRKRAERGVTVVIVTHGPEEFEVLHPRTVGMRGGRLREVAGASG